MLLRRHDSRVQPDRVNHAVPGSLRGERARARGLSGWVPVSSAGGDGAAWSRKCDDEHLALATAGTGPDVNAKHPALEGSPAEARPKGSYHLGWSCAEDGAGALLAAVGAASVVQTGKADVF